MAICNHINLKPSDLNRMLNCPSASPSMIDTIRELYDFQEEIILCVMAAGVPANCISLKTPKRDTNINFDSPMITVGFEFIRGV